jgi:CelD/BcsL family acetyltransferase involved in cellulose biosynthesis
LASRPLPTPETAAPPGGASARLPEIAVEAVPWREMTDSDAVTQWDALAEWAASPNPFFESWFLLPALQAFDPAGRVSLLRVEADGLLAGLLPIERSRRYYRHPLPNWSNWSHANCFLGAPLVARGFEKSFWRALLGWADEHAKGTLFLHLAHQPLDGPLHHAMLAVLSEQQRPFEIVHREQRALLASRLAPEAYLEAALTAKKRKELRRQHKRLAEQGALQFCRRNDSAAIDEWIEAFLWLEAAGWKGKAGSAMANGMDTTQLFTDALRSAAERGRLERLTYSLDGEPLAMLANFISPPGSFAFKTAFDERFARFSPGVLLQRENLALLERDGIEWCDSCASSDHPMIDHIWRERRTIGRASIAIGGTMRRRVFRAIAWAETRRTKGAGA